MWLNLVDSGDIVEFIKQPPSSLIRNKKIIIPNLENLSIILTNGLSRTEVYCIIHTWKTLYNLVKEFI